MISFSSGLPVLMNLSITGIQVPFFTIVPIFHYTIEKRIGANYGNVLISPVKLAVNKEPAVYLTD